MLEILPSPIVSGNKIYWYKKFINGVLVKYKKIKNKIKDETHPKKKNLSFCNLYFLKYKITKPKMINKIKAEGVCIERKENIQTRGK